MQRVRCPYDAYPLRITQTRTGGADTVRSTRIGFMVGSWFRAGGSEGSGLDPSPRRRSQTRGPGRKHDSAPVGSPHWGDGVPGRREALERTGSQVEDPEVLPAPPEPIDPDDQLTTVGREAGTAELLRREGLARSFDSRSRYRTQRDARGGDLGTRWSHAHGRGDSLRRCGHRSRGSAAGDAPGVAALSSRASPRWPPALPGSPLPESIARAP